WEQRRVGDLVSTIPIRIRNYRLESIGYPIYQQGDSPIYGYSLSSNFINYSEKTILFGDHTFSIIRPKTNYFIANDGVKILSVKDVNSEFMFYLIKRLKPKVIKYRRHLTYLLNNLIVTTKEMEQSSIISFFGCIGLVISLLQCKLEKLKNLKNTLLEKMFADEKHPFPKIRFKEFTNDWEQRRVGD
ncbi:hypothetical protein OF365_03200, partial [Ureaplasma zalophigenitalium]|nr:hypothetical protein [Ureaplasma zalophigenitalium]